MKKLLLATTLAFAATAANADISSGGLYITPGSAITGITGFGGGTIPVTVPKYTSGFAGTLKSHVTGLFNVEFIGAEAGHKDYFVLVGGSNGGTIYNKGTAGQTTSVNVNDGDTLGFSFEDKGFGGSGTFSQGNTDPNAPDNVSGIGYFLNTAGLKDSKGRAFAWIVGFNDLAKGKYDYDDLVLGISSVPVPAALPLLASAMGVFGLARRNKKVTLA